MDWVWAAVVGWLLLAIPAAVLVGRAIRRADRRDLGETSDPPAPPSPPTAQGLSWARWHLGQRHGLPGGGLRLVRAGSSSTCSRCSAGCWSNTFTDPARLDAVLLALTSAVAVAVDEQLGDIELLAPACSLRGPTPGGVDFSTAPVQGTRTEGAASVVHLDAVAGERMCGDLQTDSLPRDAEKSSQALPEVPR